MGLFESRSRKKDAPQPMMGVGMGMEVTSAARIGQPTSAYIPKVPESGQLAILPALLGGGLAAVLGEGI